MKALTVCQPFAHAILHLGKTIENRSWATSYRGPLLIHAGKSRRWLESERAEEWLRRYGVSLPPKDELAFGVLLGTVELVDCLPLRQIRSPWAFGPWCWVLSSPRLLSHLIPYRGAQKLFDVDEAILRGL